jgi:hypothetical protein
MRMNKV